MFQKLHVFDLDGTTINSLHRVDPCLKPDGDLDLQAYRETACTHDKVQADTLLPLAKYMQDLIQKGERVAICTARKMSKTDYVYLRKAGMRVNTICSRDQLFKHFDPVLAKSIYHMKDAEYKRFWLQRLQILFPLHSLVIYDDHAGVLEMAKEIGVIAYDAKEMNQIIEASYKIGYSDAIEDYENEIEDILNEVA
jgi:hypothetical protein